MKNFEKWEKEILALAYDGEGGTSFAVVNNKPVACDRKYCGIDINIVANSPHVATYLSPLKNSYIVSLEIKHIITPMV